MIGPRAVAGVGSPLPHHYGVCEPVWRPFGGRLLWLRPGLRHQQPVDLPGHDECPGLQPARGKSGTRPRLGDIGSIGRCAPRHSINQPGLSESHPDPYHHHNPRLRYSICLGAHGDCRPFGLHYSRPPPGSGVSATHLRRDSDQTARSRSPAVTPRGKPGPALVVRYPTGLERHTTPESHTAAPTVVVRCFDLGRHGRSLGPTGSTNRRMASAPTPLPCAWRTS